ncbi:hypothetical protein HYT55_05345 [Candidatus Woesearchaeota archaeon]|nr:hypothetical protein [Candidatus Woesearchaeota archaeon]
MDEADYELLPHQVLNDLKQDMDALKKRLSQPDARINELILEIESLKDNIHQLTAIFQKVLDGTKTDDPSKNLRTLIEKNDAIISQNETIARGMIAISDKLSEFMARQGMGSPSLPRSSPAYPVQHTMGAPATPNRMAPRPTMPMGGPAPTMMPPTQAPPQDFDMPPLPPSSDSKKRMGVFR